MMAAAPSPCRRTSSLLCFFLAAAAVLRAAAHPCKHRVPNSAEVVYKVFLEPNRFSKRSVDKQLRVKIVYDLSVEYLQSDKKQLVKSKLFPQAIHYLQKTFQVRRAAGKILLSRHCATNQYLRKKGDPHRYCKGSCAEVTRCGPVIVPDQHLQQCKVCSENGQYCGSAGLPDGAGIQDGDFLLYVSALTTERCGQENIVAYAAYCQLEAELDRPIAGYANLCPDTISTEPYEFFGMLSTVKHEIIHALGFSAGLFAFYHDDDGNPLTPRYANGLPPFNESLGLYQWSDKVVRKAARLWDVRGNAMVRHEVFLLATPRVVNEAMTGSHTQNRVFSRITLAIMEDTGWYRSDYGMAERLDWGQGEGCDFVLKSCKFWIDQQRQRKQILNPYCDTLRTNPPQLTCRQDQRAVAVCNLKKYPDRLPYEYQYFDNLDGVPVKDLPYYGGSVEIADYCPFGQDFSWHLSGEFQRSSDCQIAENQPDPSKNYGAEKYGPESVCVTQKSPFVMEQCAKKLSYPDWGSGCYQVSCSSQGLTVWVKDRGYACSHSGQILRVNVEMNDWVYTGSLICPPCSDLCDACPLERDPPPPSNTTRTVPIDPCSSSSNLAVTLWLLVLNLLPLVAGFFLCVWN
ncbi:leishmanolysin-like peptidase isoform X2 [Latimeria chalumnae]|uniref:leishmanolysin-like peptidase isoform X2 n=1 Tax=Latimeria chalumnae TaxID=7897 RepID=UPI00313F1D3D